MTDVEKVASGEVLDLSKVPLSIAPEVKKEQKPKKQRSEKQIAALLKAREVRAAKLKAVKVQKELDAEKAKLDAEKQ